MKPILTLVFLAVTVYAFAQKADALKWLPGTWKLNTLQGTIVEKWKIVNDSTLFGQSVIVKTASDSVLQESLELSCRKGRWFYISTVQGQNDNKPVPFEIIFLKDTEFICESPAHDFPQRISYRRIKNLLYASIEGKNKGRFTKRNFDFSRE